MQEMQETQVGPPGPKDPLKESMATHSSIFCQENPMNRGAWRAMVHGVSKSQIQMKQMSTHAHTLLYKSRTPSSCW